MSQVERRNFFASAIASSLVFFGFRKHELQADPSSRIVQPLYARTQSRPARTLTEVEVPPPQNGESIAIFQPGWKCSHHGSVMNISLQANGSRSVTCCIECVMDALMRPDIAHYVTDLKDHQM